MSSSDSTTRNETSVALGYETVTATETNIGDIGLTGDQFTYAIDRIASMGVMVTENLSNELLSQQREQRAQIGDILGAQQGQVSAAIASTQPVSQALAWTGAETQEQVTRMLMIGGAVLGIVALLVFMRR